MLSVAVIGGSGYTGCELLRILLRHPHVHVTAVTSERSAGLPVGDVCPTVRTTQLRFEPLRITSLVNQADLFFLCLPHGTAQEVAARLHRKGKRVIDLSADYRLKSAGLYRKWYGTPHRYRAELKKAVYGLPEIYREKIRRASLIANPGCYPTGALLGLAPVMNEAFIDTRSIIIDSKSGTSGAGRSPAQPLLYCEVNESVRAYAVTLHRHTPEIEQELSALSGSNVRVIFAPHLIPMDRGILSTIYVRVRKKITLSAIEKLYRTYYRDEPFVRTLCRGSYPSTKSVKGTNHCDIALFLDDHVEGGQTLIIVSAIDNLTKGASGSAVHNMNIMCGFEETAGLDSLPLFP